MGVYKTWVYTKHGCIQNNNIQFSAIDNS